MYNVLREAKRGHHLSKGWPSSGYVVSKVGVSALTIIQQREFDRDSREDLIVNSVHPGYVDTDKTNYNGPFTIKGLLSVNIFTAFSQLT